MTVQAETKAWCEHIFWKVMKDERADNSSWVCKRPDTGFEGIAPPWWNLCPVCGAKRP